MDNETLDMDRFPNLGIVKSELNFDEKLLDHFTEEIDRMKQSLKWKKEDIVKLFHKMLPGFMHKETGKYLDSKM